MKFCEKLLGGVVDIPLGMVAVTVTFPAWVTVSVFPEIDAPAPDVTCQLIGVRTVALDGMAVPVKVSGVFTWPVVGTPSMCVTGTWAAAKLIVKTCVKLLGGVVDIPFGMVAVTVTFPAWETVSVFPEIDAPAPDATDQLIGVRTVALDGMAVPAKVRGTLTWPVVGTPSICVTAICAASHCAKKDISSSRGPVACPAV